MEIPEIKKNLTLLTVLAHYDVKPDKHHQIHCPFHADDKPSCKIYSETNTYHCFACGKTGDVIQFIQDKEGITKHEAILRATALINNEKLAMSNKIPTPVRAVNNNDKTLPDLFTSFLQSIERSANAQNYCTSRGLDYQSLKIGYNSGEKWNKLKQCIIFPLKDKTGNITSLYGRRIMESKGYSLEYGKHYYSENRSGLYPNYPSPGTETLIITEAIIDAATLLQLPEITSQFTILAAYGTNGLTKEHKQAIAEWRSSEVENTVTELSRSKEIIFFFDGDTAGKEGVQRNAEELSRLLSGVEVTAVATPEKEDINSLFVSYGKDYLIQLINERKPIEFFSSSEITLTESTDENSMREILSKVEKAYFEKLNALDTSQPNKIIYETPTARYIIKGGICKPLDKMLVSLDVQHLETALKYRTRLDLYEERQARKEAREAAEKLDLRSDLLETDLSKLTDLLEEHREREFENLKMSQSENGGIPLSLSEQSKYKAFLSTPGLIERINELIGRSGITGEENNRLFLFVIATSHKMPDTLHALIQGSSGSGKTHLLSKIAELMPPERVVKFTRVTENSFYNYEEFFFRNKLICLEDIDGLKEEALFAWRELISNNQLSSSTSQKDENGNIHGTQRIVRGPMASICATTHGQIYEDNMSRLFIIAVDESNAQTTRIMDYQKQKAAGLIDARKEKEAMDFVQNLVRMLKPFKIVNPYANQLQLPPQAHKIRRLNELYLAFVKQITTINQYQRRRDGQGRLITEKEDLLAAVTIMFESIFLKVDELDGSLRQFFEALKSYLEEKPNAQQYEFTQREVRQTLHISKTQLHRYLYELIGLEYLQQTGGYANKGFKYRISYWDNIQKLRNEIQSYLYNQINNMASQPFGTPDGTLQSPSNL